jgi:nicotinate (nicotinamide) nucleotide adenylyltransferase
MEFFRRAAGQARRLGVFPGSFHPPTRAHLALARAALKVVDEVAFVLPRRFPHKEWEGAGFEDRVRMLEAAAGEEARFSVAASENGLFIEIARECREAYAGRPELYFLCGRDAAERALNWDYGRPGAFAEQLREYQLLVAPRRGIYTPPEELRGRIHALEIEDDYDDISASEVRRRISTGEPWEHLVPEAVVGMVRELFRGSVVRGNTRLS